MLHQWGIFQFCFYENLSYALGKMSTRQEQKQLNSIANADDIDRPTKKSF